MKKNKILFLDRDGVVNHDPGDYTKSLEEFQILPHFMACAQLAVAKGFKIIIITNQGGIAKGLYTAENLLKMNEYLLHICAENNAPITDIFWSPYHDEISKSLSRKPDSLMIEKALYLHNGNKSQSLMIGDKERDITAARKIGVRGILIPTNASFLHHLEQL